MKNMNDSEYQMLLVESWRRGLTPGEKACLQSFLAEQPERAADWERETALNDALNRLPDAPVASNFTSLVMQAVERESKRTEPQGGESFGWFTRWLRRPASGLAWAARWPCWRGVATNNFTAGLIANGPWNCPSS